MALPWKLKPPSRDATPPTEEEASIRFITQLQQQQQQPQEDTEPSAFDTISAHKKPSAAAAALKLAATSPSPKASAEPYPMRKPPHLSQLYPESFHNYVRAATTREEEEDALRAATAQRLHHPTNPNNTAKRQRDPQRQPQHSSSQRNPQRHDSQDRRDVDRLASSATNARDLVAEHGAGPSGYPPHPSHYDLAPRRGRAASQLRNHSSSSDGDCYGLARPHYSMPPPPRYARPEDLRQHENHPHRSNNHSDAEKTRLVLQILAKLEGTGGGGTAVRVPPSSLPQQHLQQLPLPALPAWQQQGEDSPSSDDDPLSSLYLRRLRLQQQVATTEQRMQALRSRSTMAQQATLQRQSPPPQAAAIQQLQLLELQLQQRQAMQLSHHPQQLQPEELVTLEQRIAEIEILQRLEASRLVASVVWRNQQQQRAAAAQSATARTTTPATAAAIPTTNLTTTEDDRRISTSSRTTEHQACPWSSSQTPNTFADGCALPRDHDDHHDGSGSNNKRPRHT